jgi:hypothetical protein
MAFTLACPETEPGYPLQDHTARFDCCRSATVIFSKDPKFARCVELQPTATLITSRYKQEIPGAQQAPGHGSGDFHR